MEALEGGMENAKNTGLIPSLWKHMAWAIALISVVVILALGFIKNQWGVADHPWFESHLLDCESLIIGRLQKTRQDGFLAAGGLLGRARPEGTDNIYLYQYRLYTMNLPVREFETYDSQSGVQAMVFGVIDRLTDFTASEKLALFKILTSAGAAIVLAILIFWFFDQFGVLAGIMVFISTVLSQWLVVVGKNLFWVIWAFYIPMLVSLGILHYESRGGGYSHTKTGVLLFTAVLIKCLFGYEYITTVLIMMVTPYIYYGLRDTWRIGPFIHRMLVASISGLAAVLASLIILMCQIAAVRGSFLLGLKHIMYSFGKRTYGNPDQYPAVYKASLDADPFSVIALYSKGIWCDLSNVIRVDSPALSHVAFKLSYGHIIFLFLVFTGIGGWLLCSQAAEIKKRRHNLWALIGATWFSLLAPLSWFIIFKAHSYIHTHMNFIVWHMPFALFGFALVGYGIGLLMLNMKASRLCRCRAWIQSDKPHTADP